MILIFKFCKNCGYFKDEYSVSAYDFNYSDPVLITLPSRWPASCKIKKGHPLIELNKNNDCKDYKRKWYKFWVK